MVFGMYLILIFLSIILSGCGLMKNNNNFYMVAWSIKM